MFYPVISYVLSDEEQKENVRNFGYPEFSPYLLVFDEIEKAIRVSLYGWFDLGTLPEVAARVLRPKMKQGRVFKAEFDSMVKIPGIDTKCLIVLLVEVGNEDENGDRL